MPHRRYARTWQELTGQPLAAAALDLGYRWAALQIPVQYLPWVVAHRPTHDVEAALGRIEQALGQMPGLDQEGPQVAVKAPRVGGQSPRPGGTEGRDQRPA
jgi:hypothetical protein